MGKGNLKMSPSLLSFFLIQSYFLLHVSHESHHILFQPLSDGFLDPFFPPFSSTHCHFVQETATTSLLLSSISSSIYPLPSPPTKIQTPSTSSSNTNNQKKPTFSIHFQIHTKKIEN